MTAPYMAEFLVIKERIVVNTLHMGLSMQQINRRAKKVLAASLRRSWQTAELWMDNHDIEGMDQTEPEPQSTKVHSCRHDWVLTQGFSKTYKDCAKCGAKGEQ